MTSSSLYQRVIESPAAGDHRKIGYTICEASQTEHQTTAILWFYPISGSSRIVEHAAPAFTKYRASVVSVDRPGIGDSDPLSKQTKDSNTASTPDSIYRIQRHTDDVLAVLQHHKIEQVYLLGVCIGHPFAIDVGRRLLLNQKEGNQSLPKIRGVALVAPFVSTACPHTFRFARLGARVPTFVLKASTGALTSIGSALMPLFLTPSALKRMVTEEEQQTYGWTEDDFEKGAALAAEIHRQSSSQSIEAQLGADPAWQRVCDEFATVSGCGLVTDGELVKDPPKENESRSPEISISIRACRKDKMTPFASAEWVAMRCYGNVNIHVEEVIQSHEVMTFLGGPPRNPVLLHQIASEWGLLTPDICL